MKNKFLFSLVLIGSFCLLFPMFMQTGECYNIGNDFYTSNFDILSYYVPPRDYYEYQRGITVTFPCNGTIDYVKCYLKKGANAYCKVALYDDTGIVGITEQKLITSSSGAWYQFNFSSLIHVNNSDMDTYFISAFGDSIVSLITTYYVYIAYTSATNLNYGFNLTGTYPNFTPYISGYIGGIDKGYAIFCNFTSCENSITVYNNTVNVTGKYETAYNCFTGHKIWLNFTGVTTECCNTSLTVYNNTINVTGKYETVYNCSTGNFIWLNFTGDSNVSGFTEEEVTTYSSTVGLLTLIAGFFIRKKKRKGGVNFELFR